MSKSIKDFKNLDEFYVQALLLAEVTRRILSVKANVRLSSKPVMKVKPISEFRKRMRISSLEKFDTSTYISTINF